MIYTSLNRTAVAVHYAFSRQVSLVRSFFCGKDAKVNSLAQNHYRRLPSFAMRRDPKQPGGFIALGGAKKIAAILNPRHVSQVGDSVVVLDTVDVIDLVLGPLPVHKKPRKPMGFVSPPVNVDIDVSRNVSSTRDSARNCIGASRYQPSENAGCGIVRKKFARTRKGKIGSSHEAVPSLIGQRPAGVGSTERASPFYRMGVV